MLVKGRSGYLYESLKGHGRYQNAMIMVAGSSGSGKTMMVERVFEELGNNLKSVNISITDVNDSVESGFMMFPAMDREHKKLIEMQNETTKGKPTLIYSPMSVEGVKNEIKNSYSRGHKGLLPNINFFTINIKSLNRDTAGFLFETSESKGTVRLFLNAIDSLKDNEGLEELKRIIMEKAKTKKIRYYGREIESDESKGDKKDAKEILSQLEIFERDMILMPSNYKGNINLKDIIRDNSHYHVFTYKYLNNDAKLRDFMVYYLLSEIDKYKGISNHTIVLLIDEIKNLAPFKAQGHKRILSAKIGELLDRLRKMGFTIICCTTRYTKTDEMVRDACKFTYLFKLSTDDIDKLKKIMNYSKRQVHILSTLNTGEFVSLGYENMIKCAKVPTFGHKTENFKFEDVYFKNFREEMVDYKELVKEVDELHKRERKETKEKKKLEIKKMKEVIKKEVKQKMKSSENAEKLKEMEEKEKFGKEEDRQKRDELVVDTFVKMKLGDKKPSYRNVADEMGSLGYKISYVTVMQILKDKKVI